MKSLVDRIEKEKPRFKVTKKAKKVFDRWYADLPNSISSDRLDYYGHRLMVLLAVNEEKERIESELVERVIKGVNLEMKVREQYQPFGAETKLVKVEESIRRQLTKHGPLSKKELQINIHYTRYGITLFQRALDNLMKAK